MNHSRELLKAAILFDQLTKKAQQFAYTADPMKKALDAAIGKNVNALGAQFMQKAVSSIQVNINYQSPSSASFVVDSTGTDKAVVDSEMAAALAKFAPIAAKIMSKYQKDPLDYKFVTFE